MLTILERVLGEYVEGLDRASLKVAVWSGNVSLTDLKLRKEACYALGLPVHIKLGTVKAVHVSIPWSKLGSEPVTIQLDGVYLVAGPLVESDWDEEAQREWAWARKEGRLNRLAQAAEMSAMAASTDADADDDLAPSSRGGRSARSKGARARMATVVQEVLHNLQVSFKSLHVRYEDATSSPGAPFAIGLTLKSLQAFTTDSAGYVAALYAPMPQPRARLAGTRRAHARARSRARAAAIASFASTRLSSTSGSRSSSSLSTITSTALSGWLRVLRWRRSPRG